jgi:siroheme synthase-like protein
MTTDSSETMRFLPIGLDVRGKICLVVGGGSVGTRKAVTLAQAGADVTVISPVVTTELAEQIHAGRINWVEGLFQDGHLSGVFLAVAATDNDVLNARVVRVAGDRGALVCDASSASTNSIGSPRGAASTTLD